MTIGQLVHDLQGFIDNGYANPEDEIAVYSDDKDAMYDIIGYDIYTGGGIDIKIRDAEV